MWLNIRQCTGQSPTKVNYPTPNGRVQSLSSLTQECEMFSWPLHFSIYLCSHRYNCFCGSQQVACIASFYLLTTQIWPTCTPEPMSQHMWFYIAWSNIFSYASVLRHGEGGGGLMMKMELIGKKCNLLSWDHYRIIEWLKELESFLLSLFCNIIPSLEIRGNRQINHKQDQLPPISDLMQKILVDWICNLWSGSLSGLFT